MKHVPDWFPRTSFQNIAREYNATAQEQTFKPYKFVEQQMENGSHEPSFLSNLHKQAGGRMTGAEANDAAWAAGTMYLGGSDTVFLLIR